MSHSRSLFANFLCVGTFLAAALFHGTSAQDASSPEILSVYVGLLDGGQQAINGLAGQANCPELVTGDEGIPITFSVPIDSSTVDPSYFVFTTEENETFSPICATLEPAVDPDELHTILVAGNLGSVDDPPKRVQVVGPLRSTNGLTLQGLWWEDITLNTEGPSLVRAIFQPCVDGAGIRGSCIDQIQTIWQGGITARMNQELGRPQLGGFTIVDNQGNSFNPSAFNDLNDGDNYVELVIPRGVTDIRRVQVAANTVFDPTNNPNPETSANVEF